jgi:hypothetical protein
MTTSLTVSQLRDALNQMAEDGLQDFPVIVTTRDELGLPYPASVLYYELNHDSVELIIESDPEPQFVRENEYDFDVESYFEEGYQE